MSLDSLFPAETSCRDLIIWAVTSYELWGDELPSTETKLDTLGDLDHLITNNSLSLSTGQFLRLKTEDQEIIKYEENKERYVYQYQCIAVGGIYKYQWYQ